jgi:hypothetical protein
MPSCSSRRITPTVLALGTLAAAAAALTRPAHAQGQQVIETESSLRWPSQPSR